MDDGCRSGAEGGCAAWLSTVSFITGPSLYSKMDAIFKINVIINVVVNVLAT